MAVIFNDSSHTEYTEWDYKLIKAYHFLEDHKSNNFPVWIDESDRVTFNVKTRTSKSKAAIDKREKQMQDRKQELGPGQYMYAEPVTMDGGPMPTFEEWLQQEAEKVVSDNRPR